MQRYPRFNHTYTAYQRQHFQKFHDFRHQMPDGVCAICMQKLYPEGQHFRAITSMVDPLPCHNWNVEPIFNTQDVSSVMVCKKHVRDDPVFLLRYPGPNIDHILQDFTYRDRAALSPIKIMSQITRGFSARKNYCGHYEQTGMTWVEHNIEFVEMLYGGLLGSPLLRGLLRPIQIDNVRALFRILQGINPLLAAYEEPAVQVQQQHNILQKIVELGQTIPEEREWAHNYIMNTEEVDPVAAQQRLDNLLLGTDDMGEEVSFRHYPAVMALIFPYLFTEGRGYYSLCGPPENDERTEAEGGYADANRNRVSLTQYVKQLILSSDRRFGRCTEFLFFMLDYIEKKNIHSMNRFVVPVQGGRQYTRQDVHDGSTYNMDRVSLVPHTIRSSRAYKKKHGLNLFVSNHPFS